MSAAKDRPHIDWFRHELDVLQGTWVWYLILGIILIVTGVFALGAPFVATWTVMTVISVLLLIGGTTQVLGAFWARRWSGFFALLLIGLLYVLVGILTFGHPVRAAAALTLVIALFLMVGGIFRIVSALAVRYPHWGWLLANGVVSLLLGTLVWRQWPEATFWVIGTFVGIDLIFNGVTWVMVALSVRRFVSGIAST
jgi:uncharacterized membrane protein HdeD (DUF308 family)